MEGGLERRTGVCGLRVWAARCAAEKERLRLPPRREEREGEFRQRDPWLRNWG